MVSSNRIALVALVACFVAVSAIALGSFTRLMDAGLGCPDWPACYGHFIPVNSSSSFFVGYKAWSEMIHRYVAGTLSLLILIIVGMLLYRKNILLAGMLVLLVVYQIILGAWTVTLKLLPIIVTQHLMGGFLILLTLWWIYLTYRKSCHPCLRLDDKKPALLFFVLLGFFMLILQILLGAWTSTHYAALSCPDFPWCKADQSISLQSMRDAFSMWTPVGVNYQGGVLPEAVRQIIHMAHRCSALFLTLYLLFLTIYARALWRSRAIFLKCIIVIWGLLCLQLSIGLMNVLLKLPLLNAVLHTVVGGLLLLSFATLIFHLVQDKKNV